MNILFLSPWFPYPPVNGSKIRIFNLIKELSKNHEVRLLSFVRGGEQVDPEGLSEVCKVEELIPWREFSPHGWKGLLGFISPKPRSIVDTHSPQMVKQLTESFIHKRPDLLIASQVNTAIYGGKKWKVPCIFEEVELGKYHQNREISINPLVELRGKFTRVKMDPYTRKLVSQYDACTVVSNIERELLTRRSGENSRVYVIPNGVDLDHNQPGFSIPKPNTLIYNGALTYSANYDAMYYFLRDTLPIIRRQIPEISINITGSVKGVNLSKLPLDENITLTGFLPDIRSAVAEAWACVVPLRMGGGTRLKILEAMALGTPVVATSKAVEGLRVTPEKNILLADTPEEFSQQTIKLLQNNRLHDELSKRGRELVEEYYGWDAIGAQYEVIIDTLLKTHKQER